jgi:hypothetical protein
MVCLFQPNQDVTIKVRGILATAMPSAQGGSIKMTVPKDVVEKYGLKEKIGKQHFAFVFLDTDKGLLLVPLDKLVTASNLREALKFVDTSNLTAEDIDLLTRE